MSLAIGPRNAFSQQLHAEKYRQNSESFDDYCVRYARTTADDEPHFRKLLEGLRTQAILPAGRQQRAVGWPFQTTAFNCFVGGTIPDDMKGIMETLTNSAMTLRCGGGCGWDFSTLRPEGELIRKLGEGAKASGPVSFMGIWDAMCRTIRSAGERRGAMMGVLRIDHPDIMKFIRAKQDQTSLTCFNISVGVTDEFMEAVEHDKLFPLRFGGTVFNDVRAVDLWAQIMENNWDWAEPGILFLDTINKMNPLRYLEHISATNPCVPGDTMILTKEGQVPIANRVGMKTEVWNGSQWSTVVPRKTGNDQPLVDVRMSNGTNLVCTPDHKFVLHDGQRRAARNLRPGYKLTKGSWPTVNTGVDVETDYTQGFLSGDGWFDKHGRCYIGLYEGKQHLIDYLLHESAAEYDVVGGYPGHNPDYTRIYLKLDPKQFEDKEFVPDCSWSVKSRLRWLAGMADSDGYVTDDGQLQISSKNKVFLEKIRLMLQTVGVFSSINTTSRRVDEHRLLISAYYVVKMREQGFETHRVDISYTPARSSENFVRVESVTYLSRKEDVYCFTEELQHQGVFNGILTGQCGEQPLPPDGACLLLSHNMVMYLVPTHSNKKGYEIDFDKLKRHVDVSVRACDNVFENTIFPLAEQRKEALDKRRMGVGVTGMANALEVCGYRYGSPGYLEAQSRILEVLRDTAYLTSIDMAKSKGAFPLFDAEKWLSSAFAQTLPDHIRHGIAKHGLRNGLLLSIAPTGTISWTADNVSSGIEAPLTVEGERDVFMNNGKTTVHFNDWAYEEHGIKCKTALECTPDEHIDVLCAAQRYVDSSISKTTNVKGAKKTPQEPGTMSYKEFKELYMKAYKGGAKGCSTFNINGKRAGIIRERVAENTDSCYITADGEKVCG